MVTVAVRCAMRRYNRSGYTKNAFAFVKVELAFNCLMRIPNYMKAKHFWKAAFLLIVCSALVFSCSKEESLEDVVDNSYYVRFKIDGTSKEYVQNVLAVRNDDSTTYSVAIQGLRDLSATPEGMAVIIAEPEPIAAKVYAEINSSDSPALLYRDSASTNDFTNLYMTTASGTQVIISQIDSVSVRGSFSGTIADMDGNTRVITDGSFHAKFQ